MRLLRRAIHGYRPSVLAGAAEKAHRLLARNQEPRAVLRPLQPVQGSPRLEGLDAWHREVVANNEEGPQHLAEGGEAGTVRGLGQVEARSLGGVGGRGAVEGVLAAPAGGRRRARSGSSDGCRGAGGDPTGA